ncbi:hypothetical protein ES708_13676 [subsurface metagenome]
MNPAISLIAICCITALAIIALANGIDGAVLASAFALIGGIAGYSGKKVREAKKGKGDKPQ